MEYFRAVQEGKTRVQSALQILQGIVGIANPVLFVKMKYDKWEPVGQENLYSVLLGKNDTAAVVVCDSDGNTKAMSGWLSRAEAEKAASALSSSGLQRFDGEIKLPI
jgi:hypothetical protein